MKSKCLLVLVALWTLSSPQALKAQLGEFAPSVITGSQDNIDAFQYRPPLYKTSNIRGPVPSNRWWSNLLVRDEAKMISPFPLFYSTCARDYPCEAEGFGMAIGYRGIGKALVRQEPNTEVPSGKVRTVEADVQRQLQVWNRAMDRNTTQSRLHAFGDWHIVTETRDAGAHAFYTTITAGSPFTYFQFVQGQPKIRLKSWGGNLEFIDGSGTPVLASDGATTSDRLLVRLLDVADQKPQYWAFYSAPGTVWKRNIDFLEIDLGSGANYLNSALLTRAEDFDLYYQHAYAKIIGTKALYQHDEAKAEIQTQFQFETELQRPGFSSDVLTTLFPHQYKNLVGSLNGSSYPSMRGAMKVWTGKSFSTRLRNQGLLLSFNQPNESPGYNAKDHKQWTEWESYVKNSFGVDTYGTGKALQRAGASLALTESLNMPWLTQEIMDGMYKEYAEWFSASIPQKPLFWVDNLPYKFYSSYLPADGHWGHLTGWRAGFGTQALNDLHFHAGYWVYGAALLAKYHPTFVKDYGWAVEALIRNIAAPSRDDPQFPYLRVFDPYAGRSYASGYYWNGFFNGNDQESTSESLNAWQAIFQWGQVTGQKKFRDLGLYLYWTERSAVEQYWFDIDHDIHHSDYAFPIATILREGSYDFATHWGSREIEELYGIELLPMTPGSLHLGLHRDYLKGLWNSMTAANRAAKGVDFDTWHGTMLDFLALVDPAQAVARYRFGELAGKPGAEYSPIQDHETWSLIYNFIHNLNQLGLPASGFYADTPSYGVFEKAGIYTFVAFNPHRDRTLSVKFYGAAGLVHTIADIPPLTTQYSK